MKPNFTLALLSKCVNTSERRVLKLIALHKTKARYWVQLQAGFSFSKEQAEEKKLAVSHKPAIELCEANTFLLGLPFLLAKKR